MNPNACVEDSEFFDFYTSRSIKDYITLTDKKYSVRSVSHRFIARNEVGYKNIACYLHV